MGTTGVTTRGRLEQRQQQGPNTLTAMTEEKVCDKAEMERRSLQEMFEEGMTSIGVHRKKNVFQDLEKRTLSDEEQAIINQRVEHQRKMYELFEKREKQRKIAELKEVCPDISEEEASRALDYCNGNEEQAAAALVSDAAFRRKVLNPGSVTLRSTTHGEARKSNTWSARPSGPRPKLIDRASLEGTIFVGAFRGKGFQGGKGSAKKLLANTKSESTLGAFGGEGDVHVENQENNAQESTPEQSGRDRIPENLQEASEDSALPSVEAPPSVPKAYALVKEQEDGQVRAVTDSEIKRFQSETREGVESEEERASKEELTPNGKSGSKEEDQKPTPTPTRRSTRQRTIREAFSINSVTPVDNLVERIYDLDNEQAIKMLKRVSIRVATQVLESVGIENPERAVLLHEMLLSAPNSPGKSTKKEVKEEKKADDLVTAEDQTVGKPQVSEISGGETTESDIEGVLAAVSRPTRGRGSSKKSKSIKTISNIPAKKQRSETEADSSDLIKSAIDKGVGVSVISAKGHTNRGRVKQKSHKSAELLEVGELRSEKGWYNAGYIFPEGFKSRTLFRSSVALDSLCIHECYVIGRGGQFWPAPTFKVVALDRPDEPLIAKSCTGCWTAVLKRINAEIEARRAAGEDLPPPPRTAIAGPEYFGFNQPDIVTAVEALDPEQKCMEYWAGKAVRQQAAAGLPVPVPQPKNNTARRTIRIPAEKPVPKKRRGGRTRYSGDSGGESNGEEDDEYSYVSNRWSAISRAERYRNRLQENGDEAAALELNSDNPLPDLMDPITLEPVVRPAISPYGHVMGAATWKAVLAEQGVCPFTKKPLKWEQCRVLTKANIEAYKDSIIR